MKYIKYRIRLLEPIRIADDSSAKQGQAMTQRFIPGATIRGFVINRLAVQGFFSAIKKTLFSERVRFQNAYLTVGEKDNEIELLPSPKGFYEDKSRQSGKKQLQNVTVKGEFDEAYKRAGLGTNAYIEFSDKDDPTSSGSGTICYYSPAIMSDTKIRLGAGDEQEVFRSTSIQAGYRYTGYIALDDDDMSISSGSAGHSESIPGTLAEAIIWTLNGQVTLGNARTSGLGKCYVEAVSLTDDIPYASYAFDPDEAISEIKAESGKSSTQADNDSAKKDCYMMLLSDTVMRNSCGEYCGIDVPTLESKLGVEKLEILYCATTVTEARGFNRHYGGATPSVPMYEKGSVFHLSYQGTIDKAHLDAIHRRGIGIRRNEGFGQVLFIRRYEDLLYKAEGKEKTRLNNSPAATSYVSAEHIEDNAVIRLAAKSCYKNRINASITKYVVDNEPLPSNTASQLGNILSIALKNRFTPEEGWEGINKYFTNKMKKEEDNRVHSTVKRKLSGPLYKKIHEIESTPLHELLSLQFTDQEKREIMGISADSLLTESEIKRMKLELLIQIIRYNFKQEVKA